MQVKGKTVVVTGGGRGIGRQLGVAFAAQGANIALFDLHQGDLDQSLAACRDAGGAARSYVVNVAKEADVIAGMNAVAQDFGGVDVLINNAGIT
ncbi:MAG: SDR family NAD(P)-dependent oxidoreductase, partial [Steroidobacteraceae bacterium]|nr:SDR family NAD(P)-dependent oxidoreductase [Steroidobacteraceae bacterium]